MRNSEYMAVLAEAVECVRAAMADRRLPELTPEGQALILLTCHLL